MLYAVLCYNSEEMACSWTREEDDAVMAKLSTVHDKWEKAGKQKPSIRLLPTMAATTLAAANPGGAYELRPIRLYLPGAPVEGVYSR